MRLSCPSLRGKVDQINRCVFHIGVQVCVSKRRCLAVKRSHCHLHINDVFGPKRWHCGRADMVDMHSRAAKHSVQVSRDALEVCRPAFLVGMMLIAAIVYSRPRSLSSPKVATVAASVMTPWQIMS